MIRSTEAGRFFIDITEEGCPCGCLYCYVTTTTNERLLSKSEIAELPGCLKRHPQYVSGSHGSLLTLGSHCDLFRTPELFGGLVSALRAVAPLGNPIQVSTKQIIPGDWAAQIADVRSFDTQIVIMISCATIRQSTLYEPKVPPAASRFSTFDSLHAFNIPACLYIKPFIPGVTDKETQGFLGIIRTSKPNAVCVGVFYLNKRIVARLRLTRVNETQDDLRHPLMEDPLTVLYPTPEFLNAIQESDPSVPILRNSACVVAYIQHIPCPTQVWKRFPKLCVSCQDCQSL